MGAKDKAPVGIVALQDRVPLADCTDMNHPTWEDSLVFTDTRTIIMSTLDVQCDMWSPK